MHLFGSLAVPDLMTSTIQGDDALFGGLLALFVALGIAALLIVPVVYVVTALFLMKLLRNGGHQHPVAAWVPLWSTAALFELAGIRVAWGWVAVLFAGGALSAIPYVGWLISVGVLVVSVMLTVWTARSIQAGLGLRSTGGVVLAVLLPPVWLIWMSVRSGKLGKGVPGIPARYDRDLAISIGGSFPMNWFGQGDPYAPFGAAPAAPAFAPAGPRGMTAAQFVQQNQAPAQVQTPAQAQTPAHGSTAPAQIDAQWAPPAAPEQQSAPPEQPGQPHARFQPGQGFQPPRAFDEGSER